jgi:hypothetical protein
VFYNEYMDQRAVTLRRNAKAETIRKCRVCDKHKPIAEFNIASKGEGYRRHECKFCESQRKKAWYQDNYDEARRRQNEAAIERRARIRKHDPERLKILAAYQVKCRDKAREEAFARYGGWRCACCGETERKFLTLDHIGNDGYMRKKYGGEPRAAGQLYGWLRKMGYPDGFQVLCMNCNFGKARNGGLCPHQEGSTTIAQASTAKRPEAHRALSPRGR